MKIVSRCISGNLKRLIIEDNLLGYESAGIIRNYRGSGLGWKRKGSLVKTDMYQEVPAENLDEAVGRNREMVLLGYGADFDIEAAR